MGPLNWCLFFFFFSYKKFLKIFSESKPLGYLFYFLFFFGYSFIVGGGALQPMIMRQAEDWLNGEQTNKLTTFTLSNHNIHAITLMSQLDYKLTLLSLTFKASVNFFLINNIFFGEYGTKYLGLSCWRYTWVD